MKFGNPEHSAIASYFSVDGKRDHAPRDEFAAGFEGVFGCRFDAAAAGYFHPHDGQTPDVVAAQNFGQLLGVIHHIQLRAADERHAAANEILMEVAVGIGRAVRRDEQVARQNTAR